MNKSINQNNCNEKTNEFKNEQYEQQLIMAKAKTTTANYDTTPSKRPQ